MLDYESCTKLSDWAHIRAPATLLDHCLAHEAPILLATVHQLSTRTVQPLEAVSDQRVDLRGHHRGHLQRSVKLVHLPLDNFSQMILF